MSATAKHLFSFMVKMDRNDGSRFNASKMFGGRATPDHLQASLQGMSHSVIDTLTPLS